MPALISDYHLLATTGPLCLMQHKQPRTSEARFAVFTFFGELLDAFPTCAEAEEFYFDADVRERAGLPDLNPDAPIPFVLS